MDASSTTSDPAVTTAHDQGKALVATSATSLPNHDGNGPSLVQTLNGSQTMNSHSSASAGRLTGTTVTCVRSDSSSGAVTTTAVNSGTAAAGLSKGLVGGAIMPPIIMSNSVIQTPFMNSLNVTSPQQPASHTAAGAHAVTQFRPCTMQTAGSGITLNGNNNTGTHLAANAATHPPAIATGAAGGGIPTQLPNNGQPASALSVSVSVGSNIMKAEAPKAVIQAGPQQTTINTPGVVGSPRSSAPATVAASISPGGNRPLAPQMLAPRPPQTPPGQPNIHNLQLPPGMVLVRSESGQLLMIHHQALAQMQAQAQQGALAPRPGTPTNMPAGQTPGTSIINRHVAPSAIIRQTAPSPTPISATTTLHRPPVLQTSPGAALPGMTSRTVTQTAGTTVVTSATVSNETMENVKKCKNFLSTLIKLASSGRQSSETAANVRGLVKDLLEGKLEAEDFTSRLYSELNSSPQPYLVPFLKRSLPAVRQLTPDSAAFIQQSQLPQLASGPASSTTTTPATTTTVVLSSAGPRLTAPVTRPQLPQLQPAISKPGQTAPLVFQPQQQQQQGAIRRPQVSVATTPMVTLRNQAPGRIMLGQPQVLNSVPMVRPGLVPATKQVPATALSLAQKNKLKETGGTFKDDDDINDVASMAGVNLSEESARILATNSELVGAVTRSCKDEAFLSSSVLHRRMLDICKRFGVTELDGEVVTYVSHATQQRLQNLLEKVSQVAQKKNFNFKEEGCYEQGSDVRTQLKFFEQLDQMEKQRKEEQEREILLKAAKSRARQEDPEQLRLKQKAKEMQQQELAQMRQREANLTALAAIGPRKKRKMDSGSSAAGAEGSGSSPSVSGGAGPSGSRPARQRITRVNLRDLLFCLENERFAGHSHFLYKGFLK